MKTLVAGALVLLVAGIAAPFVHADRYRGPIQSSLSNALGRKVSIGGHVSFSLFSGPALAVEDVQIAEADTASEPFAYVEEVRAIPRLYSLWTGHLEFSSLTLDGAHVNLVRYGAGTTPSWNFEPLLSPGLLVAFPTIHMRDSRINFVLDGRKSPFYLLGADLDVAPRSNDGSNWSVGFAGAPARSDRPAHGFGAVEAGGNWKRAGAANGLLTLDLKLERSEMSDMLALLYGRNAGVHGIVSGQVHVAGPMDALGIEGEARISELHGWDQSPPSSGMFPFRVSGTLNTPAQRVELFAQPRGKPAADQPTWMLHVTAESYLERPLLQVDFRSEGLPIAPLPGLLRNFGASIPEGLQLTGTVNGSVAFSSRAGWSGTAVLPVATLGISGGTPLRLEQCAFSMDDDHVSVGPVEITSDEDSLAEASALYSTQDGALQIRFISKDAPLNLLSLRFPAASIPFLSGIHSGNWSGELNYAQPVGAAGAWSGEGDLINALAALPALSQPVEIRRAHLVLNGEDLQLDHLALKAGTLDSSLDVTGDYSFRREAPVPGLFHLTLAHADLAELEALLYPLLNHGGSLIDRALGRSSPPQWLLDTQASGTIQIDTLAAGGADLSRIRANVAWAGSHIAITGLTAHQGEASLSGTLALELKNAAPRYTGSGTWSNLPWKGGSLSGTVAQLDTFGSGTNVLTNLKARGDVTGKDLELAPLGEINRLAGTYSLSWTGAALGFRFPTLRLEGDDGEVWTGSGSARGTDGEVTLRPSAGRQVKLAGSLTDALKDWVER